jgi:hypothetical protein
MDATGLFNTVPDDVLGFGEGPAFQPQLVTDFLGLKRIEVSRIASVAPSSVRFDEHIPRAVRDRFEEIAIVCNLVGTIFDGNAHKTALWFKTSNPLLGEVSPRDMIRLGRFDRLRKFIINATMEKAKSERRTPAPSANAELS